MMVMPSTTAATRCPTAISHPKSTSQMILNNGRSAPPPFSDGTISIPKGVMVAAPSLMDWRPNAEGANDGHADDVAEAGEETAKDQPDDVSQNAHTTPPLAVTTRAYADSCTFDL